MDFNNYKLEARIIKLFFTLSGKRVTVHVGQNWAFNIKQNIVTYPPEALKDKLTDNEILGFLLHELGHAKYTKQFKQQNKVLDTQPKMDLINVLEDIRIEHRIFQDYPNARKLVQSNTKNNFDRHSRDISKLEDRIKFLLDFDFRAQNLKFPVNATTTDVDNIAHLMDGVKNAQSTGGLMPIFNEIYKVYKKYIKKEDEKKQKQPRQSPKQCGFQVGIAKGQPQPATQKKDKGKGKPVIIPGKTKQGRALKHIPITFKNPLKKYNQLLSENRNNVTLFNTQLSKILRENQYNRPISGFNSGVSINTHKLYKFASRNYSFFQKRQAKVKSYQFFILSDVSGSMVNSIDVLKSVMVVLTEGFKKTGCEFGAGVFNDDYKQLKPMSKVIDSKFADNIDSLSANGGTDDFNAIEHALKEFKPGDQKIVLVITDGGSNDPISTRSLIERQRDITVIGVGLAGANVSNTYPNYANCEIDQLATVLIKTLKRFV